MEVTRRYAKGEVSSGQGIERPGVASERRFRISLCSGSMVAHP